MSGVAGIVVDGAALGDGLSGRPLGDALALVTAGWYASYLISLKRARASYGALATMLGVSLGASLVLGALLLVQEGQLLPDTTSGWWPLVGLALVPHCMGQGLIAYSLASLPASFSAVTLLLQPVAAAMWAWLLLDEQLSPTQLIAGTVVLAGIGCAQAGSRKPSSGQRHDSTKQQKSKTTRSPTASQVNLPAGRHPE